MRIPTLAIGLLAVVLLGGCGDGAVESTARPVAAWKQPADKPTGPTPAKASGTARHFALKVVARGLRQPNQLVARPDDERLYVVEQRGTVRVLAGGRLQARPYLDLRDRVKSGGELGLLSIVFTPDGDRLVALYTNDAGDTRVVSFPAGERSADRTRGTALLAVDQPFENHKGGTLLYDERGRLLVSLGDGGSAFDPGNRAQSATAKLGRILRRDHDGGWSTVAFGLRNPWRMAFDEETGLLWVGDVGQDHIEEVDAFYPAEQGTMLPNLGWAAYEGHQPLGRKKLARPLGQLTWPVAYYEHEQGACSVTGGFVYRGGAIASLRGRYVYGDFCRGTLFTLRAAGAESKRGLDVRRERVRLPGLSSFGRDNDGELYALSIEGTVTLLVSPTIRPS